MNEKLYKTNLMLFASSLLLASSLPVFVFYNKFFGALVSVFVGLFLSFLLLFTYLKLNCSKDFFQRTHGYIFLRTAIRQSRVLMIVFGLSVAMIAALWYSHVAIRLVGSISPSLWYQWKCLFLIPFYLAGIVGLSSSFRVFCELKLNALPDPQKDLKPLYVALAIVSSCLPLTAAFFILFGRLIPSQAVSKLYPTEVKQLSLDLG